MNRLLLLLCLLLSFFIVQSQPGYLFVKKGIKKKKTYMEGDRISFQTNDGTVYNGIITLLQNDTIFLNGLPIPRKAVKTVFTGKQKRKYHLSAEKLLIATGGAAMITTGLQLSHQARTFEEALKAGLVIGFSQLALEYLKTKISFKRKQYKIGKKFYLQVLDFHLPLRRAF